MTDPATTRAILDALRAYTDAQLADPRDQQAVDAARTELDDLVAQRNAA